MEVGWKGNGVGDGVGDGGGGGREWRWDGGGIEVGWRRGTKGLLNHYRAPHLFLCLGSHLSVILTLFP